MESTTKKKKWKLSVPHPYVLIAMLILLCTICTWVIPAGKYDTYTNEAGTTVVDPNSFHYVERTPVNLFEMVQAIPKGMSDVGWIIFLVFIIGGSFGIINKTGAIEAGLGASVNAFRKRDMLLIIGLMVIFSLGGATFALAESTLIFIPMCVMLAKALGYDEIVGMAIVNIGACIGFAAGWMNMYTVGVAQGIAGLPLFSGMGYRIICHVVLLAIAIAYVIVYARKCRKNPLHSCMYGVEQKNEELQLDISNVPKLTVRRKIILWVILAGFVVLIYGVTHGWSTSVQICALFLVMGVVCGIVGGMNAGEIADAFINGAKGIVFGALLVGLCRAMVVIITNGQIIDTILHALASVLNGLPSVLAAAIMVPVQLLINFLINSGSGQAAATIPIMAPLSDLLGVSRQTAVLAFQFGDGLSNSLWPTSGILMAGLSIAGIPFEKWWKWVLKLEAMLYLMATVLTMISMTVWAA